MLAAVAIHLAVIHVKQSAPLFLSSVFIYLNKLNDVYHEKN